MTARYRHITTAKSTNGNEILEVKMPSGKTIEVLYDKQNHRFLSFGSALSNALVKYLASYRYSGVEIYRAINHTLNTQLDWGKNLSILAYETKLRCAWQCTFVHW